MSNSVVNLPSLIAKVAEIGGVDLATSRRFLHELFGTIETALASGDTVGVEGVGEFRCGAEGDHAVLFKAADSLAARINEPFSAFTPVEVNEGAETELMGQAPEAEAEKHVAESVVAEPIMQTVEEPVAQTSEEPAEEPAEETVAFVEENHNEEASEKLPDETREEPREELQPKEETVSMAAMPPRYEEQPSYEAETEVTEAYEAVPSRQSGGQTSLWLILGIMIGLIIGLVGGYFAGKSMGQYEAAMGDDSYDDELVESVEEPAAEAVEALEPVTEAAEAEAEAAQETASQPTQADAVQKSDADSKEPVYDSVTSSLAKLAQKHYGVKNYWVFIYEVNPQLVHPNKIAPGTKVLIPPYDSFAAATKGETDALAQRKLAELSKKYDL